MSLQKDARITVGVDGAAETARALGAISDSVQGIASDIGHVVTAAGAISFAGAISQVHALEETVTRVAVAGRHSVGEVQAGVNELARGIGELPQEVASWTASVGRLTYSYEGAAKAAKGMKEYAALTGESFHDVEPLAVALQTVGHVAGDTSRAVGMIVAQAEKLHAVGGAQAIGDSFLRLQGQISQLANSEDVSKVTALLGGFGSKSLTPQQRERALGSVMSRIESNPEGFERFLGHSITDENGHVQDMAGVLRELAEYGRRGRGQRKRLQFTFGAEAAAALVNTDYEAIREAEEVRPSTAPSQALAQLQATPAGQRQQARTKKAIAMEGWFGAGTVVGDAYDAFANFAGENPLTALIGAQLAPRLFGQVIKRGASLFARGAATAAGSGSGAAGGAVAAEEGALGSGALSGFSSTSAAEGVVDVTGGALGATALSGGVVLGGVLATVKTLMELGEASRAKQGFSNRQIGADEANNLVSRAHEAEAAAPGERAGACRRRSKRSSSVSAAFTQRNPTRPSHHCLHRRSPVATRSTRAPSTSL
jgi:hypothetical protein